MKKTIIFALVAITMNSWAQNATIKGRFSKENFKMWNTDKIVLYKQDEGSLTPVSEIPLTTSDYSFSSAIGKKDLGAIRYIGVNDEVYPVYMRAGEELTIEAGNGHIVYSGKVNAENKVFADWYNLILPLRKFAFTTEGRKTAPVEYAPTLDSLKEPAETFIGNIKTGNESFDRYVKYMLPYSFKYDALAPFAQGLSYNPKQQYPPYIAALLNDEKFADSNIWSLPFGYYYIQYLTFIKHFIYNSEMGYTEDVIVQEISDKNLKAEYIIKSLEKQEIQKPAAFIAKNQQYLISNKQKEAMKVLERRVKIKEPGCPWIDFSYPDINGKVKHLSDFLGKVVLVDVWATWCRPCIAEQPALEELEKSFKGKDVVFISVSLDTDKAKWKTMVENKKLSGLHLFSNAVGPLVSEYEVVSVPRYILFDKDGKMLSFDAPRPSDPKLAALIQSKL